MQNCFIVLALQHGRREAFACDVIAVMLEGKNNTFSLPWEIRSIFMQNCFIVLALQHGCRENPLYVNTADLVRVSTCT